LNSFVFEIDPLFSTYYDNKVARIIANELLYTYIFQKINDDEMAVLAVRDISDGIIWTDIKNALIELIYALYANSSLSNGKNRDTQNQFGFRKNVSDFLGRFASFFP